MSSVTGNKVTGPSDKRIESYVDAALKDWPIENQILIRAGVAALIRDAVTKAIADERRICAAYVLDRADQYVPASGCWHGIADAAHGIAKGEAAAAEAHGEFDAKLYARVDGFKGKAPVVRPTDEVGP